MKTGIKLKGLNCANCAAKIEKEVKELSIVEDASVNLATEGMNLTTGDIDETQFEKLILDIKGIVKSHEPDVGFTLVTSPFDLNEGKIENEEKKVFGLKKTHFELLKIIIASILFAISFYLGEERGLIPLLIAYVIVGYVIIGDAFKNIIAGQFFDENFLMSIATFGAFAIGEYREAVGVMLFYSIGEYFQDLAVERSRKSISGLMNLRPDFARVRRGDKVEIISPSEVITGDIIIVNQGERIPVDSTVVEGFSSLDQKALTGESLPRDVEKGFEILSGSVNLTSTLTLKANKVYSESTVARIMDLMENSSDKKAETEKFITKFARIYTPIVVFSAILVAILPPLITGDPFNVWIRKSLIFLVISCPCALVISIPLGFFGGLGLASKNGILIKGSNYLENLNKIRTLVADKTGTITKGEFKVTKIFSNIDEKIFKRYALLSETRSPHPIAKSIVEEFSKDLEINDEEVISSMEIKGKGIKAALKDGKVIFAGNKRLMKELKLEPGEDSGSLVHLALREEGRTKYLGYILVEDVIKDDSKEAIMELKKAGVNTIMLSGDEGSIVEKIAGEVGIFEYYGNLLPQDKVEKFREIKRISGEDSFVAFTGDGLNDTPVLKLSDIGISMGQMGSEAAIEASDVVIAKDSLKKIASAMKISSITKNIIIENIVMSLGVKLIVMLQSLFFKENIWLAIFADVGVALLAVLNSTRLIFKKVE